MAAIFLIPLLSDGIAAQVYPVGLDRQIIRHIAAEQGDAEGSWFPGTANLLFASVHGYGVYQGYTWDDGKEWNFVGPAYDPPVPITALGVQHWGYGPRDGLTLYVGLQHGQEAPPDAPVLLARGFFPFGTADSTWTRADSGLLRMDRRVNVTAMESFHFSGHMPPQPVIAWTDSSAMRSGPGGVFWSPAEVAPSQCYDLDASRHWYGENIWGAGMVYRPASMPPYQAAAFRSRDSGEHWEVMPFDIEGKYRARAVAVTPGHPDTAWVSVDGDVYRTTDGGAQWTQVLQPDIGDVIALACDPLNPGTVFAAADRDFQLYRSTDLGDSWQRIQPAAGYNPQRISCMTVALMETLPMSRPPRFGLFLGTIGHGVWVYDMLFGPTSAQSPPRPSSPQLTAYPNPARDAVSVTLQLGRSMSVDVEILDLLGRVLHRRSFGTKPPGTHTMTLNVASLPPGSYVLRLSGMSGIGYTLLRLRR
ncbi:MAG: T9SS type A sorting domain-containing protein [Bacteroidota bacterium]|nr:T9SS type A sorting domain-containing protein [Bacteroidota bacterium]